MAHPLFRETGRSRLLRGSATTVTGTEDHKQTNERTNDVDDGLTHTVEIMRCEPEKTMGYQCLRFNEDATATRPVPVRYPARVVRGDIKELTWPGMYRVMGKATG